MTMRNRGWTYKIETCSLNCCFECPHFSQDCSPLLDRLGVENFDGCSAEITEEQAREFQRLVINEFSNAGFYLTRSNSEREEYWGGEGEEDWIEGCPHI